MRQNKGGKRPPFDKKGDRKTPSSFLTSRVWTLSSTLIWSHPLFRSEFWLDSLQTFISISIFNPFFSKKQQNWDRHSILFSSKSKQTLKYFRFVDKNGTKFSLSNKACGMILGEFRCRLHSSDKKSWKNTKCSSFGVLKLPICIMQMAAEFFKNFLTRIL